MALRAVSGKPLVCHVHATEFDRSGDHVNQGVYDIERAGGLKSMVFGGEGLFLATLQGTGTVYLQSLPFSRLADRVIRAAGPFGNKGEGSVLGNLGDVFGDR